MVRGRYKQLLLAQLVLFGAITSPEDLMDPILRRIDEALDDEALLEAVLEIFRKRRPNSGRRGRYGTPAEVALRMLVLKHLRNWSFETLEWEVRGNIVYRRFCRIDAETVPDAKTMVRLAQLVDGPVLRRLFERVTEIAIERGVAKGRKMRIDTTVVEAPIHYPTDSRLLEDSIRLVGRHVRRVVRAGVKLARPLRNTVRSVGRRAREIAQIARQRGDAAKEAIKKPYRGLLRIAGRWIRTGEDALEKARAALTELDGKAAKKVERSLRALETMLPRHGAQYGRQSRSTSGGASGRAGA